MSDTSLPSAAGGCLCGAVRFRIGLPPKWVAHCHCSMCRRAHGAGYVTWVGVEDSQFTLLSAPGWIGAYASSVAARRSFCRTCGTPLFFRSERWPGEVHVARACVPGDVGLAPQAHVFFSDRVPWIEVADHLPRRGGLTGTEAL